MKLKLTETITKEVEIELPYFSKSACHFYKVYSDISCITVCTLDGNLEISQAASSLAFRDGHTEASNEHEFDLAYENVMNALNLLTHRSI
jgi:hypothetical protein